MTHNILRMAIRNKRCLLTSTEDVVENRSEKQKELFIYFISNTV